MEYDTYLFYPDHRALCICAGVSGLDGVPGPHKVSSDYYRFYRVFYSKKYLPSCICRRAVSVTQDQGVMNIMTSVFFGLQVLLLIYFLWRISGKETGKSA